ncbi:hypothetical protein [Weissella tructae]|uniref:hypothetical protein n=1 Tax=Weissella tructae TaxID=887702 RepID=UPI001BDC3B6F|nr:hypothetical protein [Weissella tructae]QVV90853.1 hypothetical protein KHQ32_04260 [Weissella tructae]
MGARFTLNDDQRELRETYNEIGWPGTLNKSELVVYEMMSPGLLTELYLSRPDAPVIKRERGFYVL